MRIAEWPGAGSEWTPSDWRVWQVFLSCPDCSQKDLGKAHASDRTRIPGSVVLPGFGPRSWVSQCGDRAVQRRLAVPDIVAAGVHGVPGRRGFEYGDHSERERGLLADLGGHAVGDGTEHDVGLWALGPELGGLGGRYCQSSQTAALSWWWQYRTSAAAATYCEVGSGWLPWQDSEAWQNRKKSSFPHSPEPKPIVRQQSADTEVAQGGLHRDSPLWIAFNCGGPLLSPPTDSIAGVVGTKHKTTRGPRTAGHPTRAGGPTVPTERSRRPAVRW